MIEICALASGSNGNCYYVGNENEAVLVDAGISCKQILLRMDERGLDQSKVKAIFISHEHSDHLRGARVLSKRINVPVYFSNLTYINSSRKARPANCIYFDIGDSFEIGAIKVHSFRKQHDAADACSFNIEINSKFIGVMTDIGSVCENVIAQFARCNIVFLESNYDEEMLNNGTYPWYLKQRILSNYGHLSNIQALELVQQHAGQNLNTIFLSHLSGENNSPEKAIEAFSPVIDKFEIIVASRFAATEVYRF